MSAKWTGRLGDYVKDFASAGINDIADEEFNVTASGGIIEAPEGTEVYCPLRNENRAQQPPRWRLRSALRRQVAEGDNEISPPNLTTAG